MHRFLAPVLVTPPAFLPVTLEEAKLHCRVDGSVEDNLITSLIEAATNHLDGWSGIAEKCLITQTWRVDLARFPSCPEIRLPLAPVTAVTIKYFDPTNIEQTLPLGVYEGPFTDNHGPFVALKGNEVWPTTSELRRDAVRVTLQAGYGDATKVPPPLKRAILLLVGHWFANREAIGQVGGTIDFAVNALITPYRRIGV